MTKNEKLKQIREAVDLALEAQGLDSTRALVFGCKTEYGIITRIEEMQLFLNGKDEYISKDQAERYPSIIIGRDIDWEDCFLAMENPEISFRYFFGKPLKIQIEKGGHLMCTWKPKVPLHLQDPTTIDFIHNLIINNK